MSREEYARKAVGQKAVPLTTSMLADMETPLSAYWKLSHDEPCSFLLESVTGGEQLARYSIIGVRPSSVFRSRGRTLVESRGVRKTSVTLEEGVDPLGEIFKRVPQIPAELTEGLPKFCGGAVGMIAYDYVRQIESIPESTRDDLQLDDIAMMMMDTVVVFDHAKNLIILIVLADGTDEGYTEAEAEMERLKHRLRSPLPGLPRTKLMAPDFTPNMSQEEYEGIVGKCIDYIKAGDAFQIVVSQRMSAPVSAHPLSIYRAIRSLNPSPYMYIQRFGDFDVVGASPELLVSLESGVAKVRPIAGTRHRGATAEEDDALATELLADEKERAEHVMLIDLGRNDLGRVCDYGSVHVGDLMTIEKYSHVMHIVSGVSGQLRPDVTAAELVRACFPAGTLSGAPKVRAMQIIDELEPTRRGLYGGAIGYFSASGDLDLAIAIRSALIKGGQAHIQAGAGVVFDSNPAAEHAECHKKAQAIIRAVQKAHTGLEG